MTKHDPKLPYRHMLDHAQEALELAQGRTRADFDADRLLSLALVRLLEIIGEAANRIPNVEQARYPQIPWSQIVSLRNRLIHGYDSVDYDIVWQIVIQDLAPLVNELEIIVSSE